MINISAIRESRKVSVAPIVLAAIILFAYFSSVNAAPPRNNDVTDPNLSNCSIEANKHPVAYAGDPTCQAYMAIYVDRRGNFLYQESVYQDPTRVVPILPQVRGGGGGCGMPQCFVCWMPSRCGCTC
jgi:hypothetical protein